ncbi:hypothetical protein Y717_03895 [Streptomyces scopuliridis RB72]|uniref:Uncharacterized protein n=2 Tax=Streptomyces scopuliridis TaxID=452529 RepID=A0A2T7TFN5_9ACTN|nr:hypothetical protein Y717_03895 [Streptomyces scopuliridis RB72]
MVLAGDLLLHSEVRPSGLMKLVDRPEGDTVPLPPLLQGARGLSGRLPVDRANRGVQPVSRLNDLVTTEQHDLLERPPPLPLGLRQLRDDAMKVE